MNKQKKAMMSFVMLCFVFLGLSVSSSPVYAKKITSIRQAETLARQKVRKGTVIEVGKDYENGILIYDVRLWKETKEYELTYRASDGRLLSYDWQELRINRTSRSPVIGKQACRKLALKEVSGGTVSNIVKKYDDGIYKYKVKLLKGDKRYSLEYHARTKKLLEYGWELKLPKKNDNRNYIGWKKAKKIALSKVPGGEAVKVEIDKDHGLPVYKAQLVLGEFEYEIKIHAKTGRVLNIKKDFRH